MQKSLVQDGCNVVALIQPQAVVAYDANIDTITTDDVANFSQLSMYMG